MAKRKSSYTQAINVANEFVKKFIKGEYVIAGSIRRKELTIGDVDIMTTDTMLSIEKRILVNGYTKKVNGGTKKMDIDFKGFRFNIYHAEPNYWGAMLFFLTGPAGYSTAYRKRAKERKWKLNQYGLWNEYGELLEAKTEKKIYDALGKKYKQPELRGKI